MSLPKKVSWQVVKSINRLQEILQLLISSGVMPENGVWCVTPIVDGEPRIQEVHDTLSPENIPDYLDIYLTESGFDFGKLLYDDYFEAIHLLWNNKKYISCLKVLFSAIDTFGFIEYGSNSGKNCFVEWLDTFCNLDHCAVTSRELWELRNSLIHMSNLDSRRVLSGSIERLTPQITDPKQNTVPVPDGSKPFHVALFVLVVLPSGIEKWLSSYNQDREKIYSFVERYDRIVSEARMVVKHMSSN